MGADAGADAGAEAGAVEGRPRCSGYSTRYWDCCKAHCGWPDNVPAGVEPAISCAQNGTPHLGQPLVSSACDIPGSSSAYTCFSMRPWSESETLAYGFAAVPSAGDVCGRCYQIEFDGTGHYDANDPGSMTLQGKRMIVQATNIGHDVSGGQFDILIPGGGVGLFDACSSQWGVTSEELGAQYGGFLTACRAEEGAGGHEAVRACVRARCHEVFSEARFSELRAGCEWFVDWFNAADNPNLNYLEVECPEAIVSLSGVDRRALGDIRECRSAGGGIDRGECECDCAWAQGGESCGEDDGSCCWLDCCG